VKTTVGSGELPNAEPMDGGLNAMESKLPDERGNINIPDEISPQDNATDADDEHLDELEIALLAIEDELIGYSGIDRVRAFAIAALKHVWPLLDRGMVGPALASEQLDKIARANDNFRLSKRDIQHIVNELIRGQLPIDARRHVNGKTNGHHVEIEMPPSRPEDSGRSHGADLRENSKELLPENKWSPPPLTCDDWTKRDLPKPDCLSGDWMTTTSRAALIAPTGIGKTNLAMQLGYHISLGRDFLHWRGGRPCRVLYIDGEMSRRLFRTRIIECRERAGEASSTFFALSHEDVEDFQLLSTKVGQRYIDRLISHIGGVDLIVFDSIMCLVGGDLRESLTWLQTLPWIKSLTKQNIGQIWIHHTGINEERGYGDKTKEWQLDTVMFLERVENNLTDVSFRLQFHKARERTPATRADFRSVKIALVDNQWTCDGANISKPNKVSPTALRFLDALNNVLASSNTTDGRRAATSEAWKAECVRLGLIDKDAKPDSARSLFSKYRRELVSAYRICCEGDLSCAVT
jgi:hypothetical protein